MRTLGEVLAYRELEEGGPTQYKTGQHGARMWGTRTAHLTYVDNHGWLIMMPCALDDYDRWYPMGRFIRVNRLGQMEVYPISPDFQLSLMMLQHLSAALARKS